MTESTIKSNLIQLIKQQVRVTEWDISGLVYHTVGILSQPDIAGDCFEVLDERTGETSYEFDWFQVETVNLRNRAIYMEEPEEPLDPDDGNQNFYETEPGDYDPADPDAYFPGCGEE